MICEVYTKSNTLLLLVTLLLVTCSANPYLDDTGELNAGNIEDYDNDMDRYLNPLEDKRSGTPTGQIYMPMRRACIRRGANCDNRMEDCCYNSACRCNLWGSNCKCQRLGLFQKWGK